MNSGDAVTPAVSRRLALAATLTMAPERLAVEEGHSAIEVRILNPDHVVLPSSLTMIHVLAIGKGLVIHLVMASE